MTDEQIEKERSEYADAVIRSFGDNGVPCSIRDIRRMIADGFRDGANFALSHQWVSVDDRLPRPDTICLVFGHQDFGDGRLTRYTMMAHYDGENFYDAYNDSKYHPEMWMPIPIIPQLNPEKQSI